MLLPLLTAFAVIAVRLVLFFSGKAPEGTDFMLVHFLALVTIVFFTGHGMLSKDPRTRFPDLMRDGFRNAAIYAVLIALFLWIFYKWIDTKEFPTKIAERVALLRTEGMSEEEAHKNLETMFNPFNYASITFFALLAVGAFNALLVAILHHKVLRRFR